MIHIPHQTCSRYQTYMDDDEYAISKHDEEMKRAGCLAIKK